uniref:Uncharacterized protein n=1 Tax=Arcella intermedia TaxID=1963864 RepID=A0A6B2L1C6_9EUKA
MKERKGKGKAKKATATKGKKRKRDSPSPEPKKRKSTKKVKEEEVKKEKKTSGSRKKKEETEEEPPKKRRTSTKKPEPTEKAPVRKKPLPPKVYCTIPDSEIKPPPVTMKDSYELFYKYQGVPIEKLQNVLSREDYMKLSIQRFLLESKLQSNVKNNVVNEWSIDPYKDEGFNYKLVISNFMHICGTTYQPLPACVAALEVEMKKFIEKIVVKLTQNTLQALSTPDNALTAFQEGQKVQISLDDLARVFYPEKIRLVHQLQYYVALSSHLKHLRKINKSGKKWDLSSNEKGEDSDVIDDLTEFPDGEVIGALTELQKTSLEEIQKKKEKKFYFDPKAWVPACLPENDETILEEIHKERAERLLYRDKLAQQMSPEEYLKFAECYKSNIAKPRKKFEKWLTNECGLDAEHLVLPKVVLDSLAHLAHLHLESIVQVAIRQHHKGKKGQAAPVVLVKLTMTALNKALESINEI